MLYKIWIDECWDSDEDKWMARTVDALLEIR